MSLEILESNKSREFWIGQEFLSEAVRNSLMASDVIVTPLLEFREGVPVSFHQGTLSFLDYLQVGLRNNKLIAEICAPDDEYYEIALHGKSHRLSNIIVTVVVAPLVVNLMANYIYDELNAKPDDNINVSITLEHTGCKTYDIEYDGKAVDFSIVIDKVKELSEKCNDIKPESWDNKNKEPNIKEGEDNDDPNVQLI